MIPYFEKTLCSVAQEIMCTLFFFILFKKLFNVDVYRSLFDTIVIVIAFVTKHYCFSNFLTKTAKLHKNYRSSLKK